MRLIIIFSNKLLNFNNWINYRLLVWICGRTLILNVIFVNLRLKEVYTHVKIDARIILKDNFNKEFKLIYLWEFKNLIEFNWKNYKWMQESGRFKLYNYLVCVNWYFSDYYYFNFKERESFSWSPRFCMQFGEDSSP